MTLTPVLLLLLIAAIIFGLDFLLGFAPAYGPYAGRAHALACCLVAVSLLLWHGGM